MRLWATFVTKSQVQGGLRRRMCSRPVAALAFIMKEWTRTDATFELRVDHLKNGGGWNAGHLLTETTVHDDNAEDVLTGSEGNDWFLFNSDGDGGVKDKATDLSVFESLYALDIDWLNS